jgi:E3 ubiquitin-protein transferase RMND5
MIVPGVTLDRNIVNKAVSDHLYRSALFDIAREFSEIAHVEVVMDDVRPFGALHSLLSALRNNNRKPAIDWAVANRSKLADCGQYEHLPQCLDVPTAVLDPEALTLTASTSSSSSSPDASPQVLVVTDSPPSSSVSRLEFSLHRLGYLDLLENGKREDALRYARRYLVDFVDDFLFEVQELMACLLFAPDINKSPYADLVTPSRQQDLERMLIAEYCRVMDLTVESPLLSVVRCGARALPVLLKASVISSNWKELRVGDVLPVEIELRRDYQFHTVFTCPVSREEAIDDGSKPMMLPCGHVLSKQSISRMPRGHQRFKCPYCPREQVQSECKPIQF